MARLLGDNFLEEKDNFLKYHFLIFLSNETGDQAATRTADSQMANESFGKGAIPSLADFTVNTFKKVDFWHFWSFLVFFSGGL